jgi:predicted transposase/invertase (TIGR01784 family)
MAIPKINLNRPIMQKAAKLIDDDGLTPQERMAIIDERDYNNMRRKEWEDGLQQGLQTGQIAEKHKIARNLLAKGFDHAVVAETTCLSIEELESLRNKQG